MAKPAVALVQPDIPAVLRPSAKAKTLQEGIKHVSVTNPSPAKAEPTAIPDVPAVIKPNPHGLIPTSQHFYLPEPPPEGHAPLAAQIQEHLKKRPPIHTPDEVIAEDLSVTDPKER